MNGDGLLKMAELAERSGVSTGTIKHYLREGLLGDEERVVRTSRNMAYYPPEFVERIRLIKRLQEDRYMPLARIREQLEREGILQGAATAQRRPRTPREEAGDLPANVLDRLEEIGVLTPDAEGYDDEDRRIVEAIVSFRAGGYEESIGFTVYDTLRYREALLPLVQEEVGVLLDRLAGEVEVDRAVAIIASGREPLRDLIGAMHSKLLLAELERRRGGG